MPKENFKFHFDLRVRWSECDVQGIVFNGAYSDYLEVAQGEYYRNLGIPLYDARARAYLDTATVKATLEFKASARLDEMVEIHTRASRVGNTSITLETEIYRKETGQLLTWAEMIYANFNAEEGTPRVVPESVRKLINHFESTGEVLPIEEFPDLMIR